MDVKELVGEDSLFLVVCEIGIEGSPSEEFSEVVFAVTDYSGFERIQNHVDYIKLFTDSLGYTDCILEFSVKAILSTDEFYVDCKEVLDTGIAKDVGGVYIRKFEFKLV